ncbi:YihY/virulence factor BrkB family protein [Paenibacillaceae bacterium]|nr:YihY/virulence factor BrkB family protein [Paenibacillaceae bacterium]
MKSDKRRFDVKIFLQQMQCRIRDNEVPALSAQLTYYLILSFFPFLIFLIAAIGYLELSGDEFMKGITTLLPVESGGIVTTILDEVTTSSSNTLLSAGMLATLWAASNGINAVIKGLNKAYDEEETRPFWKVRGIALLATLVLVVIILLCMGLLIFGRLIGESLFRLLDYPGGFAAVWGIGQYIIPLVIMTFVFMMLYRIGPNRSITFREAMPGAIFATAGWIIASLLFSYYVSQFGNYTKTYGSLGGVIVLLIWLYISSIILLLGGEINAALAFEREGRQRTAAKSFSLGFPYFQRKNNPRA